MLLFVFNSVFGWSQIYTEKKLVKIFRDITRLDQSDYDKPDLRNTHFAANFEQINSLLIKGVPLTENTTFRKRNNRKVKNGLTATYIHILQSAPSLLLNESKIEEYSNYIKQSLLSKESLEIAMEIFQADREQNKSEPWNKETENFYKLAKKEWNLK